MLRIIAVIFAALTLSGCFCLTDTRDKSDVPEYFSACWAKVKGKESK